MLNFDADRFISIQSGAVALAEPLHAEITRLLDAGRDNLYFLGAGGAGVLMQPAAQLLQRATGFRTAIVHAAEIVAMDDVGLGDRSIVVIPSLSGTTEEALQVLEFAQRKGAHVITLTGHDNTPAAMQADANFTNFAEDDTSSESFYLQSLLISLSVMEHQGMLGDRERIVEELRLLPALLVDVKRSFESSAMEIAEDIQNEAYHIISGAGYSWAEAWYYGTCILEEMQWIRTRPIHAADFFHGTLELVEEGVSVIVLQGEDGARPLTERVISFVPTVTEKMRVLDTADFVLPGISSDVRKLISPIVLATMLERLSTHLEVLRDHPLTTRRYYRKVAY